MTVDIKFTATKCAICDTGDNVSELYPANFTLEAFNADIFSARRLPDMLHYRIVQCRTCGLVRSDPIVDSNLLADLYQQSAFRYEQDVANLQNTYGKYLRKLENYAPEKKSLLEIGCGNGFFLETALSQGYTHVKGIEPSKDAIQSASPEIKPHIVCNMMQDGLFDDNSFDVLCMFQMFDHVAYPNVFLQSCRRALKPGGLVLCFNHNVEAFSAKLFGVKSPIIDIEHTFLYSPKTMKVIFERNGFKVLKVSASINQISLYSLARLIPVPQKMKKIILSIFQRLGVTSFSMPLPLGNLYLIAQKEF